MKLFKYFLSHSLFVAICAASLTYQTFIFTNSIVDNSICFLVFFSTLAAYNFYWILTQGIFNFNNKLPNKFKNYWLHLFLLLISIIYIFDFVLKHSSLLLYVSISFLLTFFYCIPFFSKETKKFKNIGFIKTILLAFTWSFVTTFFAINRNADNDYLFIYCLFFIRFLFIFMLSIIFDSRDAEIDSMKGIHSIATVLNEKIINKIFFIIFIIYLLFSILISIHFSIHLIHLITFVATGILALLLFLLSKKNKGYVYYYFVVDGLMLFSSFITYLSTIH